MNTFKAQFYCSKCKATGGPPFDHDPEVNPGNMSCMSCHQMMSLERVVNLKEILDDLEQYKGRVVKLRPGVEESECGFEAGMLGRVISVGIENYSGEEPYSSHTVVLLELDWTDWVDYNKEFGTANWYDKNNNPCLYWWETPHYPQNHRYTLYDTYPPRDAEAVPEELAMRMANSRAVRFTADEIKFLVHKLEYLGRGQESMDDDAVDKVRVNEILGKLKPD